MNKKVKIILGIFVFAIFLIAAVFGYKMLLKKYKPNVSQPSSSQTQDKQNKAPDFTVQDKSGKSVSLSDFKGKPVVLNFWASWCGPCQSEMPDYESMYNKYSVKGINFVMVNLTDGNSETVSSAKQFLKDNNYNFTAYFDVKSKASNAYNILSIPESFFIDKNGNIISGYKGVIDKKTMEKNIEALLK